MSRKIKPCVTVPYWKILQDKEKAQAQVAEDKNDGKKEAPSQPKVTLLDIIGGGLKSQAEATPADKKVKKPEPPKEDANTSGPRSPDAPAVALLTDGFTGIGQPGPVWEKHSTEGWWWHPPSGLMYSEVDLKFFVWEDLMQRHIETDPFFKPPEDAALSFRAEASTVGPPASSATGGGATSSTASPGALARSVIIRDLVAAGLALKQPLKHLGRPSAFFAIFQGHGSCGSDSADFHAKNFHAKLLHILSQYRGFWTENLVQMALCATFEDLDQKLLAKHGDKVKVRTCSCAVALLLGMRLLVATRGECQAALVRAKPGQETLEEVSLTSSGMADRGAAAKVLTTPGADIDFGFYMLDPDTFPTQCLVLCARDGPLSAPGILGARAGTRSTAPRCFGALQEESARALLMQRRPRGAAGALAMRLALPNGGDAGALSGSALPSIVLVADFQGTRTGADDKDRAGKRPRTGVAAPGTMSDGTGSGPSRIRCRQILLKHRDVKQPTDPVRKQRVVRSREEAEAAVRALLFELLLDVSRFPQLARKHSECSTCLRGGEQAGDVGWLTRGVRVAGSVLPREAEEVAFALEVGELSDLVASETGIHLLQRVA